VHGHARSVGHPVHATESVATRRVAASAPGVAAHERPYWPADKVTTRLLTPLAGALLFGLVACGKVASEVGAETPDTAPVDAFSPSDSASDVGPEVLADGAEERPTEAAPPPGPFDVRWARYVGVSNMLFSPRVAIASDHSVYVSLFAQSAPRDYGTGTLACGLNGVLLKHGADGGLKWARCLTDLAVIGLAVRDDAIVVSGQFRKGDGTSIAVVSKLTVDGGLLWRREFVAPSGQAFVRALSLDDAGSIYLGIDADTPIAFAGTGDAPVRPMYLVKLSAAGDQVWVRPALACVGCLGGWTNTVATRDGSVYLAGVTYGSVDFGEAKAIAPSTSEQGVFVVRFGTDGVPSSIVRMSAGKHATFSDLHVGAKGRVAAVGRCAGNLVLSPVKTLECADGAGFVATLSPGSLSPEWATFWPTGYGSAVLDISDRIWAAGSELQRAVIKSWSSDTATTFPTWSPSVGSPQSITSLATTADGSRAAAGAFVGKMDFGGGVVLSATEPLASWDGHVFVVAFK